MAGERILDGLRKYRQRYKRADKTGRALPFKLKGTDSDNGPEFCNVPLFRDLAKQQIQFTRGRPYKKDDNAHIEQKNWTHARRLICHPL